MTLATLNIVKFKAVPVFELCNKALVAGATGLTSVRRCQKFPSYLSEPIPAGSRMDPLQARAEPTNGGGSIPGITDLRKEKVAQKQLQSERVRLCKRKSFAGTKVREEGAGGGAPGIARRFPCSLW